MNRNLRLVVLAVAVGLLPAVVACKSSRSERVAASYSSVTKPTYQPPPAPRPPEKLIVGIDSIPTEEEYEVRAASTITDANLPAKLSELERE
jgi:hypothetical protein